MKTSLFKLLLATLTMLFVATSIATAVEVNPMDVIEPALYVGGTFTVIRLIILIKNPSLINLSAPKLLTGVFNEIWDQVLAENLFRTYEWILKARDRSGNVLNNAVVHIPQAGALPTVYRDRVQYPVNVTRRVDSDITYAINVLSSDAMHISDAEKKELNYNKIANILSDMTNQIAVKWGQNTLYRWAGSNPGMLNLNAANIVRTTGASTAGIGLPGTTGNRNKVLVADIATGKGIMITQTKREINDGRRIAVMNENMYGQLKSDALITSLFNLPVIGAQFNANGDLVRIHGFDIIRTDILPRFNNAGTPVAKDPLDVTVINAVSDNDVILLIDLDRVHTAKAGIQIFQNVDDALMQGDYYSALCRTGASRERFDQAGVVAIVQQ